MGTKRKVVADIEKKLIGFDYNKPLKTKEDVKKFFQWLLVVRDVSFHPDNPFSDYVNNKNRRSTFTKKQIPVLDKRMEEAFEIMGDKDEDGIYALAIEVDREVNGKLQKGGRVYGKYKSKTNDHPAKTKKHHEQQTDKMVSELKKCGHLEKGGNIAQHAGPYLYKIESDEPFKARVEDSAGHLIWTLDDENGKVEWGDEYYLKNKNDVKGLHDLLVAFGVIHKDDVVKRIYGIGGKVNRLVTCCEDGGELTVGNVRQYFDDMDTTGLPAEALPVIEEIRNHPAIAGFDINNETFRDVEKLLHGKVKKRQAFPPTREPDATIVVEAPPTIGDIDVQLPPVSEREALNEEIETLKASLPYLTGPDKKAVQEQIDTIKMALKYLPEETESKFKAGDMYSEDFDYDGMLQAGINARLSMGKEYLEKLFDSFEDVNYHNESAPLYEALQLLEAGDKTGAEEKIKEFNKACQQEMDSNPEEMGAGGRVKPKKYVVFNKTDGFFASPDEMTMEAAEEFVKDFPKRYATQGFYRTGRGERIKPEDVVLKILPFGANPFKDEMAHGGGIRSKTEPITLIPYTYEGINYAKQKVWVDSKYKHPDPSGKLIWGYGEIDDPVTDYPRSFTPAGSRVTVDYKIPSGLTANQEKKLRADAIIKYISENHAQGGSLKKDSYKVGELVYVKNMGSHGLVGLVMSDKFEDEGEIVQKVYYRGYMGDIIPTPVTDLDSIENGHMDDAQRNGDLSAYKSIAKKIGVELAKDYEALMDEDDE